MTNQKSPTANIQTNSGSKKNTKTILVIVWLVLTGLWLGPSVIINLYTFGGIDFPSDSFGTTYLTFGILLQYGTAIVFPIVGLLLVRGRDIAYRILIPLLAVPVVIQILAIVAYTVLTDRYGTVCC